VIGQLALVLALVIVNAAFAGTELALVTLREGQLRRLEHQGRSGAVLVRLARDPNRFLATIQIGITLAGFLASAAAAVSLAGPIEDRIGALGGAARPVSIVIVTLVLAYVTLVFGELAPKRIAMQRAERWGLRAARPLAVIETLTRPVVALLSVSTDLAVRLLGGDPSVRTDEVTPEELRELVSHQPSLSAHHRTVIEAAFEISDRTLREVLRPRGDVVWIDADAPVEAAMATLVATGHSRAPVAVGGLDAVVGMVHLRWLVDAGTGAGAVRALARALPVFPESATVLDAMRRMQDTRDQMALVVDEHGAAEGIVTMEDLVEELVGEIYDDADRDVAAVGWAADGSLTLPGRFPVHDLVDIGIDVTAGPYTTVAGLVLAELGHVPAGPGERVEVGPWRFEVTRVTRRAITEVRVRRVGSTAAAGVGP